jgi:hypothetical protein
MRMFRPLRQLGVPAALLAGMLAVSPGAGGQPPEGKDKGPVLKGEVKIGFHQVRLEAGRLYRVRVEANGFVPKVAIRPGGFTQLSDGPGQPGRPARPTAESDVFEGIVAPKETREYDLVVVPNPGDLGARHFTYEATVTPLAALLDRVDRTTPADPRYQNGALNQGPYKEYPIRLRPGQACVITLDQEPGGGSYDPFLILEGPGGEVVAQDDDGGGNLNSRIVHRSKRGGEYWVIATGLGGVTGGYRVRVISGAADDGGGAAPAPGADAPRKSK